MLKGGGPWLLTTSAAECSVTPDGYVQAFLLKDGQKLSLDESNVGAPSDSDFVRVGGPNWAGKDVHFTLDFAQAEVHEAIARWGSAKRVGDSGASSGASDGFTGACWLSSV